MKINERATYSTDSLAVVSDWLIGIFFIVAGLAGLVYGVTTSRAKSYLKYVSPMGLDLITYRLLPGIANASLIVGGAGSSAEQSFAVYAVAAAIASSSYKDQLKMAIPPRSGNAFA